MSTAFGAADILLPKQEIGRENWAVVACDQYTSEPEYWSAVDRQVGVDKSTLRLILPELYLEEEDVQARIGGIHITMQEYLSEESFQEYKNAMIYVERIQSDGKCRAGLVGKIDLEAYDYTKGSESSVRATEATVLERIPPRIKVRRQAPLELPHIMILIDDANQTVIEPLAAQKSGMEQVYDFDLMQGGGHLSGYLVPPAQQIQIDKALTALADPEAFRARYGLDAPVLLYAMGDGNHSLATAKAYYEQLKSEHPGQDFSNHPARYALVEIVNLHSPALQFEAIHRIVTGVNPDDLMQQMQTTLGLADSGVGQSFTAVRNGKGKAYYIQLPTSNLSVGSLQGFLDSYLKEHGGKVDYIHGADVVKKLSMEKDSIGFLLADMGKEELFPTVIRDGALPRKTFSMGHAADKRFYMECRRITK